MTIALEYSTRRKLVASLRLLDSNQSGEREAALAAFVRLLPDGVSAADIFERGLGGTSTTAAPPSWRKIAQTIANYPWDIPAKERNLAENLTRARYQPTEPQLKWLLDIAERLGVEP